MMRKAATLLGVLVASAMAPAHAQTQSNTGTCNANISAGTVAPGGNIAVTCVSVIEGNHVIDDLLASLRHLLGGQDVARGLPPEVAAAIAAAPSPQAVAALGQLIASHATEPAALAELYFARGNAEMELGAPDKGSDDLGRATLLGNGQPRYALAYAAALVDTGDYPHAARVYTDLLSALDKGSFGPTDDLYRVTAMLGQVQVLMRDLRTGDARDRLAAVLSQLAGMDANRPEVRRARIVAQAERVALFEQLNDIPEAAQAIPPLLQQLDRHPEDLPPDLHALLIAQQAVFLQELGQDAAARAGIDEAVAELAGPGPGHPVRVSPVAVMVYGLQSRILLASDPPRAEQAARTAVDFAQRIARAEPSALIDAMGLFYSQDALAEALDAQGKRQPAEQAMQSGLATMRDFAAVHPEGQGLYAVALANAADFDLDAGRPAQAAALIDQAVATSEAQPRQDPHVLVFLLVIAANAHQAQHDYKQARDAAGHALDIARTLVRSDAAANNMIALVQLQQASAEGAMGDVAVAEQGLDDAFATARVYVASDPAANLPAAMETLRRLCTEGEAQRAAPRCAQVVALVDTAPPGSVPDSVRAQLLSHLGGLQAEADGPAAGLPTVRQAQRLQAAALQAHATSPLRLDAADTALQVAGMEDQLGRPQDALHDLQSGLQVLGPAAATPTGAAMRGALLANLALHQRTAGDSDGALASSRDAVEAYRSLAAADPGYAASLADATGDLGLIRADRDDPAAIDTLTQAVALFRDLQQHGGAIDEGGFDAVLLGLGQMLVEKGRFAEATSPLQEAVQRDTAAARQYPDAQQDLRIALETLATADIHLGRHAAAARLRAQAAALPKP